jgi:hypothetical protein
LLFIFHLVSFSLRLLHHRFDWDRLSTLHHPIWDSRGPRLISTLPALLVSPSVSDGVDLMTMELASSSAAAE